MWCIYTLEYYSAIKKHEMMPFVTTCIDLESIILSKVISQTKTNITYLWNLKNMIQVNLFKSESDSQILKTNYGYQRGNLGGVN